MDTLVHAAIKKWPNVPSCYGWLGLDARGNWYMRDEHTQAAGPFAQSKGSRIEHEKLRDFIARNYAVNNKGCWFFQNGPQRVYVELEVAPWVWRLTGDASGAIQLHSHTGLLATEESVWLDEAGRLFLLTHLGFGLVHSMDMHLALATIEDRRWIPVEMAYSDMPKQFGFELSPAARAT
jgi:Protein of unknown function (DUF2946)